MDLSFQESDSTAFYVAQQMMVDDVRRLQSQLLDIDQTRQKYRMALRRLSTSSSSSCSTSLQSARVWYQPKPTSFFIHTDQLVLQQWIQKEQLHLESLYAQTHARLKEQVKKIEVLEKGIDHSSLTSFDLTSIR
ncbi:hypothetical protein HMI56_007307 [Coelomomyces lativittatus]|nr:hypothetical protein HMI56_007307 [Coelomomyces lativittatus]